jgi:RNA polymerase sigma-70 factor, ECF subfamily
MSSTPALAPVIPIRRACAPVPTKSRATRAAGHHTLDDRKLDALYRRHRPAVFRYALGLTLGDRHLAEDITQETFLRAWRTPHLATDRPDGCHGWLTTVARNLVIDRLRHRRRRPTEAGDGALPTVAAPTSEVDHMLTALTVRHALAKLTPSHRQILTETYLRGRALAEVAEELGIPLGTAKSRVHYALRALRQELAEPARTDERQAA